MLDFMMTWLALMDRDNTADNRSFFVCVCLFVYVSVSLSVCRPVSCLSVCLIPECIRFVG